MKQPKAAARKIVVIGAGINGLVSANYLKRHGFDVTLLERKEIVGGACSHAFLEHKGKKYIYPNGASVLGLMQDFVFKETGLARRTSVFVSSHPKVIYYGDKGEGCLQHKDPQKLQKEWRRKWNEQGDVTGFERDCDKVVVFLRKGYRAATPPSLEAAREALGDDMVKLWITGTVRDLVNHYLTSDYAKIVHAVIVTESGPVSVDAPYSAFTIPLMASGSVFGGAYGYVKGGLWTLLETLGEINEEIGVNVIRSARVTGVDEKSMAVSYEKDGLQHRLQADKIIFATDPLQAAQLKGDQRLVEKISGQKRLGSSGKLVLAFNKAVRWKGDTGAKDFSSTFKFIMPSQSFEEFERDSQRMRDGGKTDFTRGCFQIYCEGAANRKLGGKRPHEVVSVFFKNVSLGHKGEELDALKKQAQKIVLSRIENRQDLITSILLTPRDLSDLFYFSEGNIDHTELTGGQTFADRTYSAEPQKSFYQFGENPDIYYCAAGAYPCGSIAGTPGYMCAQQIIRAAGTEAKTPSRARRARATR